jgi:XTP/dITP diphosphohydrolase
MNAQDSASGGLLVATSNPGKLRELRQILAPSGVLLLGLDALDQSFEEPVEDGASFEDNARLKARSYAAQSGRCCLAEDSGLEVDALGGAPGVYSARYAGVGETREERDAANNAKLLAALAQLPSAPRTARFVCTLCLCAADGTILAETRGTFPGVIIDTPRGTNGFGYDPLLLVPELGLTSAQLAPAEKNARSHRGAAARLLLEQALPLLRAM